MKHWKERIIHAYSHIVRMARGINKKKVVFISFGGKSYSDNPRAISEALSKVVPDAEVVWLFNETVDRKNILPKNIRCVNNGHRFKAYGELATASVCINNFSFPRIPKSKHQLFIQTWHGDKAFKTILHDSPNAPKDRVISEQLPGYCDYAIAGSDYGERQYRSAFHYQGVVLKCGTPRNDRLIHQDQEEKNAIRNALNCGTETKIMIYAPTLRWADAKAKEKQTIQQIDLAKTIDLLEQRDGCKWICLLRAHPSVSGLSGVEADERIVDVSKYEDMVDLLLVSDLLVTDYSSCAGDFALTDRPIVLFQADRQEYLEKERTFYFNMEDSPYFIAESQEELEVILSDMTEEKAKENCKEILKFYGDCETGHAAETVAKIIKDWIER